MALKDWKLNWKGAWSWHNVKNNKQLYLTKSINSTKSKKIFYSVGMWSSTQPLHYRHFKNKSDAQKFVKLYKEKN